ncbi:MAG: sigma-70 family RNA polymerase sigma factor [Acidimicrobiia bacterium]
MRSAQRLRPAGSDRRRRFEALAEMVFDPLQRYLRRRLGPEDAADVLSDTLLVIWRRLDEVPTDDPLPWCYGVARRTMANHRRGRRRHLQLVTRLEAEPAPPPVEVGVDDGDPDLIEALDRLRAADQEILRLWAWEGLEPRELAPVLGLTVNAATIRLSRARKKLAAALAPRDVGQDRAVSGQESVRHTEEHQDD